MCRSYDKLIRNNINFFILLAPTTTTTEKATTGGYTVNVIVATIAVSIWDQRNFHIGMCAYRLWGINPRHRGQIFYPQASVRVEGISTTILQFLGSGDT